MVGRKNESKSIAIKGNKKAPGTFVSKASPANTPDATNIFLLLALLKKIRKEKRLKAMRLVSSASKCIILENANKKGSKVIIIAERIAIFSLNTALIIKYNAIIAREVAIAMGS